MVRARLERVIARALSMLIARTVATGRSFALIRTVALAMLPKPIEAEATAWSENLGSGFTFLAWEWCRDHDRFFLYLKTLDGGFSVITTN